MDNEPNYHPIISDDPAELRRHLEALQAANAKLLEEKKFLHHSLTELNFHNNAHDGIIYTNSQGEVIYANPYFLEMMGLDQLDEILNRPMPAYMWHNPADEAELVRELHETSFIREREISLYDQHGHPIFVVCSAVANRDEAGNYLGAKIMLGNLTNKRLVQAEMQQQRDLLEATLRSSPDPILVLNGARQVIHTNPAGLALFGLETNGESQPLRTLLIDNGVVSPNIIKLETTLLKNEVAQLEMIICNRDFVLQIAPFSNHQAGWVCLLREITSRKLTEDKLRITSARLKALLENFQAGVLVEDEMRRIVHVNQTFCQMFKLPTSASSLIGTDCPQSEITFKNAFVEPEAFVSRVNTVIYHQRSITAEELQLADGRIFERDYIPILLDEEYSGHLWQYRDVTLRRQAEQQLQKSEERYRLLAENANDLIMKITPAGKYTYLSPACRSILGYDPNELLNHSFYEFVHPEDLKEVEGMTPSLFDPANAQSTFTLRLLHKESYAVWLESSIQMISSQEIEQPEMVVVARDVTERKLYEAALQRAYSDMEKRVIRRTQALTKTNDLLNQEIAERRRMESVLGQERTELAQRIEERTSELGAANAELAQAARLKDEFLASMSHELRTPLNAILGMSEALLEQIYGSLNEKQIACLQNVEESGRHLLSLINDILDVSKIEAGQMKLEMGLASIQTICQASLRLTKQASHNKNLTVKFISHIAEEMNSFRVDERRLKQILVNLLSNAIKFTPEGGEIGLEVTGDSENQVIHFSVWDTGIGIPNEQLPTLFKPFVQLDSSLARRYPGTGLGLVLAQRMTELHGGSLSVGSEIDRGSRFTVSIPWHRSITSPAATETSDDNQVQSNHQLWSQKPLGAAPRILLAEDNETNIFVISGYLQKLGYEVIVTRNGVEAIDRAREEIPDIILMDIQMPEMDGLEAMRHLRADAKLSTIPIIVLTALAMPGDKARCMAAGANGYITKPVSLKSLVKAIETQFSHQA